MLLFYLSVLDNTENYDDFEHIFFKYRNLLFKVAFAHTKDHQLAENALVDVFTGVAKNIDRIKDFDEPRLEIYLCKAAKYSAISVLRKEGDSFGKIVELDPELEVSKYESDLVDCTYSKELLADVVEYIKSMKKEYTDILTLHCIHEMTLKECAKILGIPLSTAKTRLYKAQSLVNERFEKYRK